jgi:hypothetical protein
MSGMRVDPSQFRGHTRRASDGHHSARQYIQGSRCRGPSLVNVGTGYPTFGPKCQIICRDRYPSSYGSLRGPENLCFQKIRSSDKTVLPDVAGVFTWRSVYRPCVRCIFKCRTQGYPFTLIPTPTHSHIPSRNDLESCPHPVEPA